jgi:hypothetical protein
VSDLRDKLRGSILKTIAPASEKVMFFGVEIELRQPTLGDVLSAKQNQDPTAAVIETLIRQAYVPGTDERVFEEADTSELLLKPFGADFIRVSQALERMSDVNFTPPNSV